MGDGAHDQTQALLDETNIRHEDGRSLAQTWISLNDVPAEKRDRWRRIINNYHDGQTDPEKGKQNWQAGKVNDAKLFAGHLSLSASETAKLVEMARHIDFTKFGSFSNDQVLVAAASLISDENTSKYENRIILTDEYKELMEVVDLGSTQRRTIRQAIRERTDFF
jgi:hypothetical protein